MGTQEMSHRFDVLLNSFASEAQSGEQASRDAIVLDEFEKSVLLTKAQEIVLKEAYNRSRNPQREGFDDSSERQADFSTLITSASLVMASDQSTAFDSRGIIYMLPSRRGTTGANTFDKTFGYTFHPGESTSSDVMFILNERLVTRVGNMQKNYVVVPIHYREYDREMSKPYSQPLKKQVWRLLQNSNGGTEVRSEIIPRWNLASGEEIVEYRIRYIRKPHPIVLTTLEDGLSIEGYTQESPCELATIMHEEVLSKAVELALASRGVQRQSSNSN